MEEISSQRVWLGDTPGRAENARNNKNDAGALENFQHFEHPSLGTKSEQHTHKVQAQLHSVKQEILI